VSVLPAVVGGQGALGSGRTGQSTQVDKGIRDGRIRLWWTAVG